MLSGLPSSSNLSGVGCQCGRRLKVIASEDVGVASPGIAAEVGALYGNWLSERKVKKGVERIFLI